MEKGLQDLRSRKNPKARIKILKGHFATPNGHINTYIDMSTVKCRHNNARETARVLAEHYMATLLVDTIVCLDGTEVIGTFMAENLAENSQLSVNGGKNISIITPELNPAGQMIFRDNTQRMIKDQQVLILAGSITTGKTMIKAVESVLYYGGTVCGVTAIFSAISKVAGLEIFSIFESGDLPDYRSYESYECPMCKAQEKIEAIVNSYGYSKL